jgi:acetyltransferase-like isoleucine patch superfamily enzyme
MAGRDTFRKFKGIIGAMVAFHRLLPRRVNYSLLRSMREVNGRTGLLLRYVLLKSLAKSCGDNVSVQPGVHLFNLDKMDIGNNVSIHPMCYLDAAGGISIGDNVSIAHAASVLSVNHTWKNAELPIKYNPESSAPTTIADDVWIGCGVRILAGVSIPSRTVIAAGAVVSKSPGASGVYGGIPARLIKPV